MCGQELERLQEKHNGLTAAVVVSVAQNADSPLHSAFEWDDSVAAHEYRVTQARYILRSIVIKQVDKEEKQTRAFIVVRETEEKGSIYLDTVTVFSNTELRVQALNRAMKELESFRKKYADLEELADVLSAIDNVAKRKVA